MPSDRLFGPSLTTPAMAAAVSDDAWLAAMLEVEAALAAAEAAVGVIPVDAANAIAGACDPARFDLDRLGREAVASASPVVPLVRHLTALVPGDAAGFVHWGGTTQDVVDTAMMLVARRAAGVLLDGLDGLASGCAALAERHRATLMAGRTLLQQALPITFGLKAAGWLMGVLDAHDRLAEVRRHRLALQFGGAAGTLASLGDRGLAVMQELSRRVELAEPALPWHTSRGRVLELGAALAEAAGAAGKIAVDIVLLAQTEVAEVAEGAPGASSALPQKRNPVASVEASAAARGVEAQLVVLAGAQRGEHERAVGAWQAEWPALSEAFRLAGGAVGRAGDALAGLRVNEARMRKNLELDRGLALAEHVKMVLAERVGRERAHDLVGSAAARVMTGGGSFREELLADAEVASSLTPDEVEAALAPDRYLGSTGAFIDRALAAYHERSLGSE